MEASKAWTELQSTLDDWRKRIPGEAGKLLPWLIAQPQAVVLDLLALSTALSINTVTAGEGAHSGDELATAVGLDMSCFWTATGASYLAQVSKDQVVKAVSEAESAEASATLVKIKKGEAVVKAEALLAGTRWLPMPLRQRSD